MQAAVSDFVPIPGRPGYAIDPCGRVESEYTGFVLPVDKWGRVQFRQGKKKEHAYIGELVLSAFARSAHCPPSAVPAPPMDDAARSRLRAVEKDLKDARTSLEKARRVNAHLIAQVNTLRARLEEAGAPPRGKRGRAPRWDTPPHSLEDMQDF